MVGIITSTNCGTLLSMETSEIVQFYTVEHLTLRQIAQLAGMSYQAIAKRLKKAGVSARDGEHLQVPCERCGTMLDRTRERVRRGKQYCSQDCYLALRTNTGFVQSRRGGYEARALVRRHFDLQYEHIVHHEDRDQTHNDLANLRVFATDSDHMKYHHGKKIKPIWDGRDA